VNFSASSISLSETEAEQVVAFTLEPEFSTDSTFREVIISIPF